MDKEITTYGLIHKDKMEKARNRPCYCGIELSKHKKCKSCEILLHSAQVVPCEIEDCHLLHGKVSENLKYCERCVEFYGLGQNNKTEAK